MKNKYWKKNLIKKSIFVSGITRSGKIVLCNLLASLRGMENIKLDYNFELILSLNKIKKIDNKTAEYILNYMLNLTHYNSTIGRNLNFRKSDYTSVWNSYNTKNIIKRLTSKEGENAFKKIKQSKKYFLMMIHNGLIFSPLLFKIFPKLHIMHMQKHPIDLIYSWNKKNIGNSFLSNNRNSLLTLEVKNNLIPWYAIGWEKKFLKACKLDKIIFTINSLRTSSKIAFSKLDKDQKKRIYFINFDKLVSNTNYVLDIITKKFNLSKTSYTKKIINSNQLLRKINLQDRNDKYAFIVKRASKDGLKVLNKMIEEFELNQKSI